MTDNMHAMPYQVPRDLDATSDHPALTAARAIDKQDDHNALRVESAVTNLIYLVLAIDGRKETTANDMDKKRRILAILAE